MTRNDRFDGGVELFPRSSLVEVPLRSIDANLLAEYTGSAHVYNTEVVEPQFKYFLPRYFELLADCDPPSFTDPSRCLARLEQARYNERWPGEEAAVVSAFLETFIQAIVSHAEVRVLVDVLNLASVAGMSIQASLEVLWRAPIPTRLCRWQLCR